MRVLTDTASRSFVSAAFVSVKKKIKTKTNCTNGVVSQMERLRRIRTDKWRTLAALAVYAMLLAGWPSTVEANTGALIKSKSGQPLTSSTLSWVSISSGLTAVPDDAVQGNGAAGGTGGGGGGGGYVCRFQHAGRLQIGSTVQPDAETDDVSGMIIQFGFLINQLIDLTGTA